MSGFYHGAEFKEGGGKKVAINSADMSIVAIVGTAPIFMVDEANRKINEPVDVSDHQKKAMYLGENLSDYTLYDAVDTVLTESGGAKIYVVNVFDPQKHKTNVTDEASSFINGKIILDKPGMTNLTVKKGETALGANDYVFSDGVISIKAGGSLSSSDEVLLSYTYPDPSKVTAADIIGTVDEYDIKTGMKCIEDIPSLFKGDEASILIAPVYEAMPEVARALENLAVELKAYTYTAAPVGTTKADAIKGRGEKGTINFASESSSRMLLYPYVGRFNVYTNSDELKSSSPVAAGLRVKLDRERGPHKSISNTKSNTVTRIETPITYRPGQPVNDTQNLNSKGITVFVYDNGWKIFGNRSACFPAQTGPETFECVKRMGDFIDKSILKSTTGITDEPITNALIDMVCDAINAFFDILKNPNDPMLIGGSAWYDPALNSAETIANGWTKFCYEYAPPTPNERTTFYRTVNVQLYKNIGSEAA